MTTTRVLGALRIVLCNDTVLRNDAPVIILKKFTRAFINGLMPYVAREKPILPLFTLALSKLMTKKSERHAQF